MEDKHIQVLGYRQGHDRASGKPYIYQKHFSHIKVTTAEALFKNLPKIVELIPESERYDVHYTVANCYEPTLDKTVPLRLFHHQEMIPIDLDHIDLSRKDEYITIVQKILQLDLTKTGIFCSGHGLHMIVLLTQPIENGEELHKLQPYYKALASKITMEFFNSGLVGEMDSVRFAESATLRLPLTMNNKDPENPVQAYIIQGNVEPQPFYLDRLIDIKVEEEIKKSVRAVDSKAVLSGCDFLKYCYENPQSVSEPQWYAMVQLLAFIPEIGRELCHTYSKTHTDYSYEDTENKVDQALGFGKPRTCDGVQQVFPACTLCPNYGKCKTPLALKSEEFIGTKDTGFHDVITSANGGQKFVPNYGDLLKYFNQVNTYVVNKESQQVFIFNGTHWKVITEAEIDAFATSNFNPVAKNTMRSEFRGLLLSTNQVDSEFFNKDNFGFINFANGVLRLQHKVLEEHSPKFGFNYVLPYDYNEKAICPEFDKMMDNITLKDTHLQQLLLEYLGYAISGMRASYGAKALILTGQGSNGKSTFLDVIKMLIGKNCFSTISLEDMSNPNARFSMVNKLFNICEEVEENELRKGTAMFKSVVTGADLMVKKLYSDTVSMRIDCKLILSCNELPTSRENTYAIYRRMLIVPFRAKFDKTTGIDKGLLGRIEKEMSGVYNRILTAYETFIKNDGVFSSSDVVEKALEEYRWNNSVYNQFFDACLEQGTKDDFLSSDEIMVTYKNWATLNNITQMPTNAKLIKELKTMGIINGDSVVKRVGTSSKRGYIGLKKQGTGSF